MEIEPNLFTIIEGLRSEYATTAKEFAGHVRTHPRGLLPSSCHPCINFKQIMLFQDVRIRRLEGDLKIASQAPAE